MKNLITLKRLAIACLIMLVAVIFLVNKYKKCAMSKSENNLETVFGKGEPNPYGEFFTGQTYLQPIVQDNQALNGNIANVTFEPAARTNWHSHTQGQILLVLDGEGRYQEKGKELQILKKGDVVQIPADTIHWHGATPDSWFVHISITPNANDNKTTWLEPVVEDDYK